MICHRRPLSREGKQATHFSLAQERQYTHGSSGGTKRPMPSSASILWPLLVQTTTHELLKGVKWGSEYTLIDSTIHA